MSRMFIDNIVEKTSGNGVHIPGHIIQYQQRLVTTGGSATSSGSFVDIDPFYVDITPKFSNSIILFQSNFHAAVTGTTAYARFRVVDSNNSDTQWSSGLYVGASGYKVIDSWLEVLIRTSNPAGTTNTMRLQLQGLVTGSTLETGWSGGDRRLVTAMEIAQ